MVKKKSTEDECVPHTRTMPHVGLPHFHCMHLDNTVTAALAMLKRQVVQ